MKDGSMFSVLDGYKEQAFYEEYPSLLLLTPEGSYEATVFRPMSRPPRATPGSWILRTMRISPPGWTPVRQTP